MSSHPRRMSAVHAGRQYLRARRTRQHPDTPGTAPPQRTSDAQPDGMLDGPLVVHSNNPVVSAAAAAVVQLLQAGSTASGPGPASAGYSDAAAPGIWRASMMTPAGSSPPPGAGASPPPGAGTWVSPPVVFTMGWWETPSSSECRRRRGRGASRVQHRHSVRVH